MNHGKILSSRSIALADTALDYNGNLGNIFNQVVCLSCMPSDKKSCSKPSDLPKFSVILGSSLVRAGGGWGGGGGHGEAEVIYYMLYTI